MASTRALSRGFLIWRQVWLDSVACTTGVEEILASGETEKTFGELHRETDHILGLFGEDPSWLPSVSFTGAWDGI